MFANLKICILEYSVDFAKKRANITKDIIIKHGGEIIDKESMILDKIMPDYVITSNNININVLRKLFNESLIYSIINKMYKPEWIQECIKFKSIVTYEILKINLNKENPQKGKEFLKPIPKLKLKSQVLDNMEKELDKLLASQKDILKEKKNSEKDHPESESNQNENIDAESNQNEYIDTEKNQNENIDAESNQNENIDEESNQDENIDNESNPNENIDNESNPNENIDNEDMYNENNLNENIDKEINQNENIDNESNTQLEDDEFININSISAISPLDPSMPMPIMPTISSSFPTSNSSLLPFSLEDILQPRRLNELIIEKLNILLDYHTVENDRVRISAYRNALNQLRNVKDAITSFNQIKDMPFIGKQIRMKIKEIIQSGSLKRTEIICNDTRAKTIKLFEGIYGIGIKFGEKLYMKGLRTIEDVKKNENLLNRLQKIGMKYYDDLIKRIPRKECEEIYAVIEMELSKILPREILNIDLCGSYRRGKETCGDIDILITRVDNSSIKGISKTLMSRLIEIGLVKEFLSESQTDDIYYQTTIICKLNDLPHRQVDIKVYSKEYYAFALLYFTGSKYFIRNMRLHAKGLGYNLTDQSIEYVTETSEQRHSSGIFIKCQTEEQIFDVLSLDYKEPYERDV